MRRSGGKEDVFAGSHILQEITGFEPGKFAPEIKVPVGYELQVGGILPPDRLLTASLTGIDQRRIGNIIAVEHYSISMEDARDAVNYWKSLACKDDKTRFQYCDGCILRMIDEGWHFRKEDYLETEVNGHRLVRSLDGKIYFAGSLQEFADSKFGKVTWLLAEDVHDVMMK